MNQDRRGRYVKPADKCTIPGAIFAVVPQTIRLRYDGSKRCIVHVWDGAHIACQYRRRDKWSNILEHFSASPEGLRDWLARHALPGRTNWVIAPSASDLLTLSEWWSYAQSVGFSFEPDSRSQRRSRGNGDSAEGIVASNIVMSQRCEILAYVERGVRWRIVGARNYWPEFGLVGEIRGEPRGRNEERREPVLDGGTLHVNNGARALCDRFRGLCEWWRRVATAPLGTTAGQLAVGILKSHLPARALCTHSSDSAHRLERSAAHGGRASLWYVGTVHATGDDWSAGDNPGRFGHAVSTCGPVAQVDIQSMYPTLLRDRAFPVKLKSERMNVNPRELVDMCEGLGVIARVRVRSVEGEYPLRRDDRIIYPTGEFVTTLAGPDIAALAKTGQILECYHCAVYALGRPFREGMSALLSERKRAKDNRDKDAEAFAKLVANSLGGKLAQRQGGWVRDSQEDTPGQWGESHRYSARTNVLTRFRHICGLAWRWEDDKEGRGPHTACFAYLTAYGRQQMRALRAICGVRTVIAQDTDGLFVLPDGIRALKAVGMLDREAPGLPRIKGIRDSGRWYGPKHYRWGDQWVLAGFHSPSAPDANMRVRYETRGSLFAERNQSAPYVTRTYEHTAIIPTEIECGRVGRDGWVDPPTVTQRVDGVTVVQTQTDESDSI